MRTISAVCWVGLFLQSALTEAASGTRREAQGRNAEDLRDMANALLDEGAYDAALVIYDGLSDLGTFDDAFFVEHAKACLGVEGCRRWRMWIIRDALVHSRHQWKLAGPLVEALRARGFSNEAETLLHDYLKQRPNATVPRRELARLLADNGRFSAALTELEQYSVQRPYDLSARLDAIDLLEAMGRTETSDRAFADLLRDGPKSVVARLLIAERALAHDRLLIARSALMQARRGDFTEGLQEAWLIELESTLERALAANLRREQAAAELAQERARRLGRIEDARRDLEAADAR